MTFNPLPTVPLAICVSDALAKNLDKMARGRGVSRTLFAQQLFDAAYAARCAPTGDAALDAAVGGAAAHGRADDLARKCHDLQEDLRKARAGKNQSADINALRVKLRDAEQALVGEKRARADEVAQLRQRIDASEIAGRERPAAEAATEIAAIPAPQPTPPAAGMTAGDRKIARGYKAAGWSDREIAAEMGQPVAVVLGALRKGGA